MTEKKRRGVDKIIPCRYIDHIILACELPSIFFVYADDDLHYCRYNTEIFLQNNS